MSPLSKRRLPATATPIHLSQAAKLSHQAGPPQADVAAFIEAHDENPKPYLWVKSANEILAVVKRFCQRTEQALYGEL